MLDALEQGRVSLVSETPADRCRKLTKEGFTFFIVDDCATGSAHGSAHGSAPATDERAGERADEGERRATEVKAALLAKAGQVGAGFCVVKSGFRTIKAAVAHAHRTLAQATTAYQLACDLVRARLRVDKGLPPRYPPHPLAWLRICAVNPATGVVTAPLLTVSAMCDTAFDAEAWEDVDAVVAAAEAAKRRVGDEEGDEGADGADGKEECDDDGQGRHDGHCGDKRTREQFGA